METVGGMTWRACASQVGDTFVRRRCRGSASYIFGCKGRSVLLHRNSYVHRKRENGCQMIR